MAEINNERHKLTVHVAEFSIPPIKDGVVVGSDAPIGVAALNKALDLLGANNFETVNVSDDVVGHVLIRKSVLRRVPLQKLVKFVIERVKPLMDNHEVLYLDIDARVTVEESNL